MVFAALLTGCHTWRVAGSTPAEYVREHSPDQILVRRTDDSKLLLLDPSVQGDSLWGFATTGGRPGIALTDVQSVSVRRTSWTRTIGLVAAVGGGVALALLLSQCSSGDAYC